MQRARMPNVRPQNKASMPMNMQSDYCDELEVPRHEKRPLLWPWMPPMEETESEDLQGGLPSPTTILPHQRFDKDLSRNKGDSGLSALSDIEYYGFFNTW